MCFSVSLSEDVAAECGYFKKYATDLYHKDSNHTAYIVSASGSFISPWDANNDKGFSACSWIYTKDKNASYTLALEGTGTVDPSNPDSPVIIEPDLTTLAGKIAAQAQITNLPTLYLTIPDVKNLDTDLYKKVNVDINDPTYGEANYHDMTVKVVDKNGALKEFETNLDNESTPTKIKVRGNSTATPQKRPYRIKFGKDNSEKQKSIKHDLLGKEFKSGSKRNWTLLANVFDGSLIRNAITYHIGEAVGMAFNPGYRFVDLVINGDYRGTYQISDQVEAGKNRVDVDEDTGWMLEFQGQPKFLDRYGNDIYLEAGKDGACVNTNIKNPDPDDLTDEQMRRSRTI